MLKFLIKLFAVFVFLIPLFLFVAKGSNPQPASAATCTISFPAGTTPVTGFSSEGDAVTVRLSNLVVGESYELPLTRLGSSVTPTPTSSTVIYTGTHVASGTTGSVTFPGTLFTPGNYVFTAKRVSGTGGACTPSSGISLTVKAPFVPLFGKNPCDPNCQTALGTINPTIGQFAVKIIKIVFGLAGGIALILMVIGAIRVLTSSGDQQKLSGGREMITAALIGLLFLIFSVLILQFILENLFGFKVNPTLI